MSLEDFFERIENQYEKALPFVAYRNPGSTLVKAIFQNDDALYTTDSFSESGFVFSPFDSNETTILLPLNKSDQLEIVYDSVAENNLAHKKSEVSAEAKSNYIALVNKAIEAISNHEFSKVVLSRKEVVSILDTTPISIFKRLLNSYQSAFTYIWYHPKVGLWLGATPETLLKMEDNRFSIMALAGTQDYKGTTEVIWNDKEIEEQQIVTDFIVQQLNSTTNNLKMSPVETVRAGNLLHLRTMISAQLKTGATNLKELIFKLHPTPAVCGFPKQEAKEFIIKNETYHRDFYSGFLGELNFEKRLAPRSSRKNIENRAYTVTKNSTQLYVNLRCMQIQQQNAHIYIGGGITEDSIAEDEWNETVSKSMIIKSIL